MSSEPLEWNEDQQFSGPCTERCGNIAIYTLTDPARFEFSRSCRKCGDGPVSNAQMDDVDVDYS